MSREQGNERRWASGARSDAAHYVTPRPPAAARGVPHRTPIGAHMANQLCNAHD